MWSVTAAVGGPVPIAACRPAPLSKPLAVTKQIPPLSLSPLLPSSASLSFSSSSFNPAASALTSDPVTSDKQAATKYYFVVANAKFMLDEEEHFREVLFERLRNYEERKKELDFWLVIEPKFLDKFPNLTQRLRRPAVALVSTNGPWITFMKLRLDRVLSDSFEAASLDEALASNPTTLEFGEPEKWLAPYPKYEFGWWETFLPKGIKESKV